MQYTGSLHNHSDYSNLRLRDAISRHTELIDYAIELGHEVIAITEHESVSNAVKIENYYNKIKKEHPNFKVILGNEIYLCRDGLNKENFVKGEDEYYHFILLAVDDIGHKQIREISTRAWMRSYLTHKMRRVPTYYQDIIDIIGANPGHVIGSTACLGGFLAKKLMQWEEKEGNNENFYQQIKNWLINIENIFGKNYFYLEMQPSNNKEQVFVNKEILKLSEELDIPYIITTDTHYLKKEDAPIHKAYLNSQDGDREVDSFYATTYLMDTEELESYMNSYMTKKEFDKAYQNILNIKNMCQDFSLKKDLKIPSLVWKEPTIKEIPKHYYEKIPYLSTFVNSDFEGDKRLAQLVISKIESDDRLQNQEIYNELNNNLEITWQSSLVNKAHWSAYFLNLQNILDVCWEAGTIVGPGRGSGVGFLLLYLLDIIQINPMWETTKTFSWRFLNPERVSVLDIDTDIEGSKRATVLQGLRNYYGQNKVANVVTFGTEGSKQAIQTAARGLEIDHDIALYISSLIPADRGTPRTLSQCYYGDKENDFAPISLFVEAMKEYPGIWDVAQRIEGIVCKVGEHAGGVIFTDEDFTNSTALMKVPNGDVVTQFDLHDCEDCSLIKIDLLSVEGLDKIHTCLDLLCDNGYIERQPTLKETYFKYLDIYKLERKDPKMWNMVWNHEIQSLFQMKEQSGIQGIALTKPESVDDLAVLNSVIRLMAQEKGGEQPLNKYARFKKNINLWYQEMDKYGLTKQEQAVLEPIVGQSYGIAESQEKIMSLVQLPECGGFNLTWADGLRKAVAKKQPESYLKLEKEYFNVVKEKGLSYNLCNYVWHVLVAMSRGYSFNLSHTLAYSLVALQEMNLAFKYPIIFWNCACLITDSGGSEEEEDEEENEEKKKTRSTAYDKIATAIGKMKQTGIKVELPDINNSLYTFTPEVNNNRILYGLSGIVGVGEEVIKTTIENRPYTSIKDYYFRVKPNKSAMISLIKGGAFDQMVDRKFAMAWYLWEVCDKKENLTLQNMASILKYDMLPQTEDFDIVKRIYEFNRYLKATRKYDSKFYSLDLRSINFLIELQHEDLIQNIDGNYFLEMKAWDKVYQQEMNLIRNWINSDKKENLQKLNDKIFQEEWEKYALGTLSAWEMEALCFYHHEHELAHIDKNLYGISNFFLLPEDPIVDNVYKRGGKNITLFKLTKICGTCIAKNKNKGQVSLLTNEGVVTVKFRKEYFSMFDRQISQIQPDGKKKVVERSWFNKGSKILVQGMRSGDNFIAKKYNSKGTSHQLYKIDSIDENGKITLRNTRAQGEAEEDDN